MFFGRIAKFTLSAVSFCLHRTKKDAAAIAYAAQKGPFSSNNIIPAVNKAADAERNRDQKIQHSTSSIHPDNFNIFVHMISVAIVGKGNVGVHLINPTKSKIN